MNNPYIYRGPVRARSMFFGREHELREIVAFLNGNQSVSVVGPRKIGKTSLLFHLLRCEEWDCMGMDPNNLIAYLDCEVLGGSNHEEIFATLAAEIAAALEERELPSESELDTAQERPGRLSFERAVRKLNQRGLRVVLILDEFERLSTNPNLDVNFFNALRSAAGRYQLAFVTASAQALIQLTYSGRSQEILSSPFFNIFAPLQLGLFPENEARQAITVPAQDAGQAIPPGTVDFIYDLVGGFPLGIQVAGFHTFELMQANDRPDLTEIEHRALQELQPHFEYYWHNLSSAEQDALRRVSELAIRAPTDTTLRTLLRDLVQKCMLVYDGGSYRYPMRAWAGFITGQTLPAALIAKEDGAYTGSLLGPYQVLELLGRGGMAEVYKGRHSRLNRIVAIKVLPARLAADEGSPSEFAQRFEREARSVAALRHPNIVEVFDFGDLAGTYYMVMEFVPGQDLARYLKQVGQLPLDQARPILEELAAALDYAHQRGLVHRDIKPSNVMLEGLQPEGRIPAVKAPPQKLPDPDTLQLEVEPEADVDDYRLPLSEGTAQAFRVVLTDFGIAKILGGDTASTQTGILMGTLDYISPEQIRAAGSVDGRADIYALGIVAYQMLTGQLPLKADNPGALMMAHLQAIPEDPRRICPEIPEAAAAALLKAMAKDPDQRFPTAGDFYRGMFAS